MLEAGGSLGEVAQLLEAAIQKKELGEGGYEAWILLGEVRSMDEREELGMLALREGVRIAKEQGGAGGVGMLVCGRFAYFQIISMPSFANARHNLYSH